MTPLIYYVVLKTHTFIYVCTEILAMAKAAKLGN